MMTTVAKGQKAQENTFIFIQGIEQTLVSVSPTKVRTATAITRDRNEWKRVEARLAEEEIRDEAGRGGLGAPENTVEDEGGGGNP